MKSKLSAVLILLACYSTLAQSEEQKGFVGLNLGVSHILNTQYGTAANPKLKTGANLNLNLGYELRGGFGIAFTLMGALHPDKTYGPNIGSGPFEATWRYSYGALSVGPMYSFNLSKSIKLDCRLQSGLFWRKEKVESELGKSVGHTSTVKGFKLGLTLRHNFSEHWCWMISATYSGEHSKMITIFKGEWFHVVNLNAGVGFRI